MTGEQDPPDPRRDRDRATAPGTAAGHPAPAAGHPGGEATEGGDPVCWLEQVCDECGAMREDRAATACRRCGTPFPTAGGPHR